jgi:molybdate transport system substrate-binding protein
MAAPLAFFCGAVKTALEHADWPAPAPDIIWGTVGALRDRVLAGERPAVAILSDAAMEALAAQGLVRPGAIRPLGRTGTGIALRDGAPRRPIATPAELSAALLAAESIGWADASSGATGGRHFERVIAALGIAEAVRAKARLFRFGVDAVAACGRGEVELAISQSTEIVGRPGVSLLGEFPAPYALSTGYAAAPVVDGPDARAILDVLAAPAVQAALRAIGFATQETTP